MPNDKMGGFAGPPPAKRVPIRRTRKACTICRGLKTRCLPDGDNQDPTARCSRCARLGLDCVYTRARRGRPPRIVGQPGVLPTHHHQHQHQHHNHNPTHPHPLVHPHPLAGPSTNGGGIMWPMRGVPVAPQARSMGPGPSLPPSANPGASSNGLLPTHAPIDMLPSQWSAVAGPDGTPILQTSSSNLYDGGTPLETSLHLANSIDSDGRSLPRHHRSGSHFSYYVEPPFPQDGARQQPTQGIAALREGGYRSAVEVGLITEAESRLLFQNFMQNLASSGGLFDPKYHTYERVRSSPPLMAAILATTARYFRTELKDQLGGLYETTIFRAFMSGDLNLQLIQALLVPIFWRRAPEDRTIYLKLGMACRLISELHIEWPQVNTIHVPQTEEEHRSRLDRERTFFNVVSMDLWYSIILQLPPNGHLQLPTFPQVTLWADQNPHLDVPGDYFKAFVSGMWDIQKEIAGAHFTLEEAVQFGGWNYDSKEKRLIEHLHLWLNSPNLRGPHLGQAQILGKTTLLKLRVIGLLQSSDPKVGGASILSLAEEIAIAIGRLASNGEIIYWYEVIFCLLPMPGILLHNARRHFLPDEYDRAAAFCVRMQEIFGRVSNISPGGDTTMRGFSRFYRRLGKAFEDIKVGNDDPNVAAVINGLLQGVPHWSPLVNVIMTDPALAESIAPVPADWAWVNNPQSQWDGPT